MLVSSPFVCSICKFGFELDDVAISGSPGRRVCICLRCYERETHTEKPTPPAIQRDVNIEEPQ